MNIITVQMCVCVCVVSYTDPPPLHFYYNDVIGRGGRVW